MKRRIVVFFHIEKCGGTSLVELFRRNLPFQACEAVSLTNALSQSELQKTLRVYPNLKVLSGHNLQIEVLDWLVEAGFEVTSFTILRDPIERAISDYLHDLRKGSFTGSLADYSQITWKHNYIAKFLGSGREKCARANLSKIDDIVEIQHSDDFVRSLSGRENLPWTSDYTIANKASDELPSDVCCAEGIAVGRYRIAEATHSALLAVNELDLQIWRECQLSESTVRDDLRERDGIRLRVVSGWQRYIASLKRNLIYKPVMGTWSKYYALPRNRSDPSEVKAASAFR